MKQWRILRKLKQQLQSCLCCSKVRTYYTYFNILQSTSRDVITVLWITRLCKTWKTVHFWEKKSRLFQAVKGGRWTSKQYAGKNQHYLYHVVPSSDVAGKCEITGRSTICKKEFLALVLFPFLEMQWDHAATPSAHSQCIIKSKKDEILQFF